VFVRGDSPWTAVKEADGAGKTLLVSGDDEVFLTYLNGEVCFGGHYCFGPDGLNRSDYTGDNYPMEAVACGGNPPSWGDPLGDKGHVGLIYKTGVAGSIRWAGNIQNRRILLEDKPAALFLGINDCSFDGEGANTGGFSVKVTVVRKKK